MTERREIQVDDELWELAEEVAGFYRQFRRAWIRQAMRNEVIRQRAADPELDTYLKGKGL